MTQIRIIKRLFPIFFLIALSVSHAFSQTKQTENTFKLDEGKTGEKATINDMKWIVGAWQGEAFGGFSEEIYSDPNSGVIMGAYRLIVDGKTVFYELMTILEENGTVVFRLKHFEPNLTGWEEKDKFVEFKFIKKDAKRIYFEGMTFEPIGKKALKIYLAIKQKDGSVKEETFTYKRVR